jgi:hypothetical protein
MNKPSPNFFDRFKPESPKLQPKAQDKEDRHYEYENHRQQSSSQPTPCPMGQTNVGKPTRDANGHKAGNSHS